jgi:hypothetical protein
LGVVEAVRHYLDKAYNKKSSGRAVALIIASVGEIGLWSVGCRFRKEGIMSKKKRRGGGFGGGSKARRSVRGDEPFRLTDMIGRTGNALGDASTDALAALMPWLGRWREKAGVKQFRLHLAAILFPGPEYTKTNWLVEYACEEGDTRYMFVVVADMHANFQVKAYGVIGFPRTEEFGGPYISPQTEWPKSGCLMINPQTDPMQAFLTTDMVNRKPVVIWDVTDWFEQNSQTFANMSMVKGFEFMKTGDSKPIGKRQQRAMLKTRKRKPPQDKLHHIDFGT